VLNPRAEAVLVWSAQERRWQDKTADISSYHIEGGRTLVRFARSTKTYSYGSERVLVLRDPQEMTLPEDAWVEVSGRRLRETTAVHRFEGPTGAWLRIFQGQGERQRHELFPEGDVRIAEGVEGTARAAEVLAYWRQIVAALPAGKDGPDPLVNPFERLRNVHPDSVLARYLTGKSPADGAAISAVQIAPFSSNLSQRAAVQNALRHPISVIEGPPGTGKTQTILNLISTLIATPGLSVGVVAFSNAAVENVRRKLADEGFGYVVANLGNTAKQKEFLESQGARNAAVEKMLLATDPDDDPVQDQEISAIAARLDALQGAEGTLAVLRHERDEYRLEREHFNRLVEEQDVPDLSQLPLLRRSSSTLIDFLADASLEHKRPRGLGWLRWLGRLVKYGPMRGARLDDTDVMLRVQQAFYERRVEELDEQIADGERRLQEGGLPALLEEHRILSERLLRAGLHERYAGLDRVEYAPKASRGDFRRFSRDYPVILSTCHSLRGNIGEDSLLDYLIIDEASQSDLLTSALAMASCRRIVVVGDERQLPPILKKEAVQAGTAPAEPYDYTSHSLMSSLRQLYGTELPVTMLREHYRCDPAIIGFCNEKFYGGKLIPLSVSRPGATPMTVVRTAEGNHMRSYRDGGRINRRELDVILGEVIPNYCSEYPMEEIGITTPYRKQVVEASRLLQSASAMDSIEADTVHKYQGRDKKAIIMSAVLDDTADGRTGVPFVDESRLVNVAVSRAKERFILVTDHRMLPTSRNLRDLMGYIQYRDPSQMVDSSIVSVFDLLYTSYSARLRPLAARLRGELAQRSEDIVWTVLHDFLGQEPYDGLKAVPQVLLRNLVPNIAGLSPRHRGFVLRASSVDIVVYNRLTRAPLLAIEVDGFAFHDAVPVQQSRDGLKDEILAGIGLPLLRLPTIGSGEPEQIKRKLDDVLNRG
jgi:DNA polymerase III delta prime subunit